MPYLDRIRQDPKILGGKPCIRDLRVSVGTIVGLLASGHTHAGILKEYQYLEQEDIQAALACAAWRSEEIEASLSATCGVQE